MRCLHTSGARPLRALVRITLVLLLTLMTAPWAGAQLQLRAVTNPPAAPIDPLMSLMLSQPPIDVDGPVSVSATFEPPIVRPGQTAIYRVVFSALEASIAWPTNLPVDPGLVLRPGGRGQILQMTGTNMQPRTTFLYRAQADSLGRFVVPQFTVQVYNKAVNVPAASLEVTPRPPPTIAPAQSLELVLSSTNVFVGEAVTAQVMLLGQPAGIVQGLAQVQVAGQGFLADQSAVRQRIQQVVRNGANVPAYIYELLLTPLAVGNLSAFAQAYSVGNRFSGPVVITGPAMIPGGQPQYLLLDSEPVSFKVRPLPPDGRLPGFTGAVGNFVMERPRPGTNFIRVGEPFTLTALVRGQGNLGRLVAPPAPVSSDWQITRGRTEFPPPQVVQLQGFAGFEYTLIPLREGPQRTPSIPFSYFDPVRERYVDLSIPSVPVEVLAGNAQPDLATLAQADALATNAEPELKLSALAAAPGPVAHTLVPVQQRSWFPLVQITPGLIVLGLIGWDRRRRFVENHPDLILRRRARRALRRQRRRIREAVRAGDAPRFAATAAEGLRIAGAPHYPAEPRALVCSDILPLLPEADRAGAPGQLVRRIFAVNDATQFGEAPAAGVELLALHADFEGVLRTLEEKL